MSRIRWIWSLFTAVLLAAFVSACGGGGGSAGVTPGGGGGTTPPLVPSMALGIYSASNAAVTGISVGGGFKARATLIDGAGAPIVGRLVTFTVTGDIATLSPVTSLTNASGIAEVAISPSSLTAVGAATLSASATVDTATVSKQFDFSVAASSLSLSPITIANANLPSGGNTTLSVTALVGNAPSTGVPVNVSFSVSCGQINGQDTSAAGVSVTTNGSGVASASYSAVATGATLCSGPVTLTASSVGASSRTATINVAQPVANAVAFVTATPAQIFVSGSGAVDQSVVKFIVRSSAGTALPGVDVVFSIETNPGGVGLNASGTTANVNGTTNQAGEVSVSLFSGTIPGPVKVRAALATTPAVFAESQNLTVSSGPPSQRFMSLSVSTFNIEGWQIDGTPTSLTVRLADRQGNPVDDGTVVNFTAEGGQVAGSCATLKRSGIASCSVDFVSQNPRTPGGRVSVLAYTSGTKDYDDVNGNNRYDPGTDTLKNLGDPYRDDNENNAFDASEFVVPLSGTDACAGSSGTFPSRPNTCDNSLATRVRQQAVILFSSTSPVTEVLSRSAGGILFRLGSADNPLLPMPAGTTISATTSADGCSITDVTGSPVPSVTPTIGRPTEDLRTNVGIGLKGCAPGTPITVRITAPSGLVTAFGVTLN